MEHMTLAEAAVGLDRAPIDIAGVLDRAVATFDRRKQKRLLEAHITRMQRALNVALAEIARCETLLTQLRTKPAAFRNLDKSEKRLRAALSQAAFITAWANLDVEAAQRTCANAKSLEDTVSASRALYAIVKRSALAVRPILNETLQYVRESGS
jgi:hypothetical protein